MMRSRLAALAAAILLGCSHEAAPGPEIKEPGPARDVAPPTQPVSAGETPKPPAQPVVASAPPPPTPSPPVESFAVMEVAPTQGDLIPVLTAQAERAKGKNLRPVAYFYADWCPPCKLFQAKIDDPQMREALRGVYLVKLNLDDWHDKAKASGAYVVKFIPSFFLVKPDGKPLGKLLDGDKWGRKATVETLATSITAFLAQ